MKPTTELTYSISDNGLDSLRSIIGQTMYIIYAPSLSISASNNLISSYTFAIAIDDGFLNIWTEEFEEKSLYWQLNIERSSKPRGINHKKSRKFKRQVLHDPSDIELKSSSKLKSIDIYSDRNTETFNTKSDILYSIVYDHTIVFNLENGDFFCISVDTGMPDSTVVGIDEGGLRILTEDKKLRKTIHAL